MRVADEDERALARAFGRAVEEFDEGLPTAERDIAAKVHRSTLSRWGKLPGLEAITLHRLNRHYERHGRKGFLDRVYGRVPAIIRRWHAMPLDLSQVSDPRYRQLMEAGLRLDESPVEWLGRTGLLAHSHIIIVRGNEAWSDHVGTATMASPSLRYRNILDRDDQVYAGHVHALVMQAKREPRLDAMTLEDGNGYWSLKIPFRSSGGAIPIVSLPHRVVNQINYTVR
jgi:hypothetical protein